MPAADTPTDLHVLLREATSAATLAAYSRGISIAAHADNRLPRGVRCDAEALAQMLRRGLSRTIEAGGTRKIAVALWRGDPGEAPVMLEACRAVPPGTTPGASPVTKLADLWALPIGEERAQPRSLGIADGIERLLMPLPCEVPEAGARISEKWGDSFRGHRILVAREVLFDRRRCIASIAANGAEMIFVDTVDEAFARARADAESGQPFGLVVLDYELLGEGAVALARRLRADPVLARSRILLVDDHLRAQLPEDRGALFDEVLRTPIPWRRLFESLRDLAHSQDARPVPPRAVTAPAIPDLRGQRILVAEDVATNQMVLKAMLAPTGADVEMLRDGAALLARHTEAPGDLILMDLQMPGMGGIAAIRRVREMQGAAGRVRAVALTAYASKADRRRALEAGMDAYLTKPIAIGELYDLLRDVLPAQQHSAG